MPIANQFQKLLPEKYIFHYQYVDAYEKQFQNLLLEKT